VRVESSGVTAADAATAMRYHLSFQNYTVDVVQFVNLWRKQMRVNVTRSLNNSPGPDQTST
jgi:hypothetical protein